MNVFGYILIGVFTLYTLIMGIYAIRRALRRK